MSILSHLNQAVTVYNRSSKNAYGENAYGSGASIKARFQERYKVIRSATGEFIETDASAWFPYGTTIDKHDKIAYRSKNWEVVALYNRQGRDDVHHVQVFLKKI